MNCVFVCFSASLSVGGGDEKISQVAQTLQEFLMLTDPVQQIQLVKKVRSELWACICIDVYIEYQQCLQLNNRADHTMGQGYSNRCLTP